MLHGCGICWGHWVLRHALTVSTGLTPILHRGCRRQCSADCLISHAQALRRTYLGPLVLQHSVAQPIEPALQCNRAVPCRALRSIRDVGHLPSDKICHTQVEAIVLLQPSLMLCSSPASALVTSLVIYKLSHMHFCGLSGWPSNDIARACHQQYDQEVAIALSLEILFSSPLGSVCSGIQWATSCCLRSLQAGPPCCVRF